MQYRVPERQTYQQYNEEENVFQADGFHESLPSLRAWVRHHSLDTDDICRNVFNAPHAVVDRIPGRGKRLRRESRGGGNW